MIGAWRKGGKRDKWGNPWEKSQAESTHRIFALDPNLIAQWANLGYVEETAIRNRILQSLISFRKLYDHHADAMIILFKIAGATFEAYRADPSRWLIAALNFSRTTSRDSTKGRLVQVIVACLVKGGRRTNENFKEILELRKRGWEGLPPPPVTPLGLPSTYLEEPQAEVAQPRPMESIAAPSETETIPGSPATLSPSITSATLSVCRSKCSKNKLAHT